MFGLDWLVTNNTTSGVSVTPSNATRCATVAICVGLLANGASIPVKLYQRKDGAKVPATDHPAHKLVHRDANEWMSAPAFRAALTRDAVLTGNGYAYINRDFAGTPAELIRLSPHAVTVETADLTGEPVYRVQLANGRVATYAWPDILHITSGVRADDGLTGVSLVTQAKDDIARALILDQTVANTFKNNERPGGIVSFKN